MSEFRIQLFRTLGTPTFTTGDKTTWADTAFTGDNNYDPDKITWTTRITPMTVGAMPKETINIRMDDITNSDQTTGTDNGRVNDLAVAFGLRISHNPATGPIAIHMVGEFRFASRTSVDGTGGNATEQQTASRRVAQSRVEVVPILQRLPDSNAAVNYSNNSLATRTNIIDQVRHILPMTHYEHEATINPLLVNSDGRTQQLAARHIVSGGMDNRIYLDNGWTATDFLGLGWQINTRGSILDNRHSHVNADADFSASLAVVISSRAAVSADEFIPW